MPIGEGFWLYKNGKVLPTYEHLMAVVSAPKTFGLTKAQVQAEDGEDEVGQRTRVLSAVLRKGWIRVRHHSGYTVFEAWKVRRQIAEAICGFIADYLSTNVGSHYQINEVSTDKGFTVTGASCYSDMDVNLAGAQLMERAREAGLEG